MKQLRCMIFLLAELVLIVPNLLLAQGNVGIGIVDPAYTLDLSSEGERTLNIVNTGSTPGLKTGIYIETNATSTSAHYGIANFLTGTATGTQYGVYSGISNTGSGSHYGSYHALSGSGTGVQTGTYNNISNTGSNDHFGVRNVLSGIGSGMQVGLKSTFTNSGNGGHIGVYNEFSSGNTDKIGVFNDLKSGTGWMVGTYNSLTADGTDLNTGTTNYLTGGGTGARTGVENFIAGGSNGNIDGVHNYISNSGNGEHYGTNSLLSGTGSGNKYAVYAWVWGNAGGTKYAGYFTGNVSVTGTFTNPSDQKLKEGLRTSNRQESLDELMKLKIYHYEYDREKYPFMSLPEGPQTGLIAQDVERTFPQLVTHNVQPAYHPAEGEDAALAHDEVSYLGVNYIGLIPHLIAGMQQQQELINTLRQEIDVLNAKVGQLPQQLPSGK